MRINVYKKNIYVVFSALAVLLLIGVSYAFFSYYRVGEKESQLIAGDIYLHYTEDGDTLVLENAFPETYEEATNRDDNYITFTIDGVNTTKNKDIYYEILLTNGSDINGKERFNPSDIMVELKETINGVTETVVDGMSYSDFNEKRIWVNTINKNTTEEVVITYQLRIWISEDVIISDTEDYANYTTDEFKNSYTSVKVNVKGDFEYKEASTDPSCFAYKDVLNVKLDTSSEAIVTCKDFFLNDMSAGEDRSDANDGFQTFCEGTGTVNGTILNDWFYNFDVDIQNELINIGIFEEVTSVEITNYDIDCGSDVIIPSRIDGKKVIGIADERSGTPATQLSNKMSDTSLKKKLFNSKDYRVEKINALLSVFGYLGITSVRFSNTLIYIGDRAFSDNLITDIVIPESVVSIGSYAFSGNPLVKVEFGGNPNIDDSAFFSGYNEDVVKKLKYGGTCQEFTKYYRDSSMFGQVCRDDISINPKEVIATDGICDIDVWFFAHCPA